MCTCYQYLYIMHTMNFTFVFVTVNLYKGECITEYHKNNITVFVINENLFSSYKEACNYIDTQHFQNQSFFEKLPTIPTYSNVEAGTCNENDI